MTDDNVHDFPKRKRPPGPGRGRKVKQGSGLPAMGPGWGGAANGPGKDLTVAANRSPLGATSEVIKAKAERTAMLEDKLFDKAMNAEEDGIQIMAAVKLHEILNGKPVNRNVNMTAEEYDKLTDDELDREIARLQTDRVDAAEGASASGVSSEPTDVVH